MHTIEEIVSEHKPQAPSRSDRETAIVLWGTPAWAGRSSGHRHLHEPCTVDGSQLLDTQRLTYELPPPLSLRARPSGAASHHPRLHGPTASQLNR